ncbi:MAG: type II toxin-antitoxin system RelE/ParE family toxin [Halioglobus sp.]|nr:type II toxin-antitoxin system RelE/ParE family toxin [Halioglobus sp.]
MRVLKNRAFSKWAAKEGINDGALANAVEEMARGLVEADLGGHVFKKRVAVAGRGKSGGVRTLLAYKAGDKAFFVYGFAKNARENIKADELDGLKKLAKALLGYTGRQLEQAIGDGALIEVNGDEENNPGRGA